MADPDVYGDSNSSPEPNPLELMERDLCFFFLFMKREDVEMGVLTRSEAIFGCDEVTQDGGENAADVTARRVRMNDEMVESLEEAIMVISVCSYWILFCVPSSFRSLQHHICTRWIQSEHHVVTLGVRGISMNGGNVETKLAQNK